MAKFDELRSKHGIKQVGSWVVPAEHTNYTVDEAPSLEAYQKFSMEPEVLAMMSIQTVEEKIVLTTEEAMNLVK